MRAPGSCSRDYRSTSADKAGEQGEQKSNLVRRSCSWRLPLRDFKPFLCDLKLKTTRPEGFHGGRRTAQWGGFFSCGESHIGVRRTLLFLESCWPGKNGWGRRRKSQSCGGRRFGLENSLLTFIVDIITGGAVKPGGRSYSAVQEFTHDGLLHAPSKDGGGLHTSGEEVEYTVGGR